MAIIGINSVSAPQKKDTLDKIAQGLNIANGVLGVAMAVPEYLQKREAGKQNIAQSQSAIEKNRVEIEQMKDPNSFQNLQKENLKGDLDEDIRLRTKLTPSQKMSYKGWLQEVGIKGLNDEMIPETVGGLEKDRQSRLSSMQITPQQNKEFEYKVGKDIEDKTTEKSRRFVEPLNGYASTVEESDKIKEALVTNKGVKRDVAKLLELRKKYGGGNITNQEDVALARQIATKLLFKYKKLETLGVLSKPDIELVNQIIPQNPLELNLIGLFGQDPTKVRLENLDTMADDDLLDFLEVRGFKPSQNLTPNPPKIPSGFKKATDNGESGYLGPDGLFYTDEEFKKNWGELMPRVPTKDLKLIEAKETKTFTPAQAVIRKYAEGLTGGLSNVVVGAIQGAINPDTTMGQETRKLQEESKVISKQYPELSGASELGGIITPQGLLGKITGGTTKLIKGISGASKITPYIARIAGSMAGGGAYSAAESISNDTPLKDAADDIINNMALSAGLGIGGEVVGAAGTAMATGGKKVLASLRGIRPESISAYAKNPKQVAEVIQQQINGDYLPRFVDETQKKVSEFVTQRADQLDEILSAVQKPVSIKPLLDAAENELSSLKGVVATPLRQKQISLLDKQIKILKDIGKNDVSASDVNEIKKQLQEQLTSFFEASPKKIGKNSLDKAIANIEKAAVKTVEGIDPRIDQINADLQKGIELQKKMNLGNVLKGGFDSEKAKRFLSTLSNDAKSELRRTAEEMDSLIGTSFVPSSTLFRAAKDLTTQDVISNFSTGRSLLPIAIGAATGGLMGEDPKSRGALGLAGAILASPGATKPIITGGKIVTDAMKSEGVRGGLQRAIFGKKREVTK